MRNLYQDAGAVARIGVTSAGAAVSQIFQNFDAVFNNLMRLPAFDVGHKADTAAVFFQLWIVETLLFGHAGITHIFSSSPTKYGGSSSYWIFGTPRGEGAADKLYFSSVRGFYIILGGPQFRVLSK